MKSITVYHYDAFGKEPDKGNPAGVVLSGDELTDVEMQEIAFKVGFNETAFPVKSDVADLRIRFFTPGHEMNLCGHATMTTVYALKSKGLLGDKKEITIETNAGILPIKINASVKSEMFIKMKQASPQFKEFTGSKEELANSIGLKESDLHADLPILYGSTGTWTLLIPIKQLSAFQKMVPNNKQFPKILKEMPKSSVHPFCLETYDSKADMHARHFSSPYSGTIEDVVTGTASGVMGAFYAKYIKNSFIEPLNLIVEQGHEVEKDGQVVVRVSKNSESFDVQITGNAVFVKDIQVLLEN
ncbi:PhzF family phenazine biosynthesis isomerase [Aquibacillus koreensis]|uniref:PhzF family phenazine biosynthesis isomerase n=1 Tax=Aquibacillus koreensis TaxID=279446 RepID=A0A9X4AKF0_9BACI|nr:PhzF family phenazine biosynthesis isomerase [Aquibacillus koreensis]MCT2536273.1 PhzF family phenazine biosynthesis isomerase [Aquibacillus koreensis]MDC3421375.1 PhzF family phenazine biosynthesis isomerase [Aquibacillus koreensis]